MFGDKLAMRLRRISGQADNFNFTRLVFFNILLKLNKFLSSKFCIVFGIESKHDATMLFESITELPYLAILI